MNSVSSPEFPLNSLLHYTEQQTPFGKLDPSSGIRWSPDGLIVNVTSPTFIADDAVVNVSFHRKGSVQVCDEVHIQNRYSIADATGQLFGFEAACNPPLELDAGLYDVNVYIGGMGRAFVRNRYTSELRVSGFEDSGGGGGSTTTRHQISGISGGKEVILKGSGLSGNVIVSVCGVNVDVIESSYSQLTFRTPSHLTVSAIGSIDSEEYADSVTSGFVSSLSGDVISSRSSVSASVNDGDYTTYFNDGRANCFVGLSAPTGVRFRVSAFRFYPRLQYARTIEGAGAVFEGSTDGGKTYRKLVDIPVSHEGWNTYDIDNSTFRSVWFTSLRYRETKPTSTSRCHIAEMSIDGIAASLSNNCTVRVSVEDPIPTRVAVAGIIDYDYSQQTAIVTSIYPINGTARGGTTLSIYGKNLKNSLFPSEKPAVTINGIECAVNSANYAVITCITGSRLGQTIQPYSINVTIPSLGTALLADPNMKFVYIDRWSDPDSWRGGVLPIAGDIVWIPEGQVILMDVNTPVLLFLLIEGDLHFDDEKDTSLDAFYIFVFGGYLQIGTADKPYTKRAVITLHGDRKKDITMPMFGVKCIAITAKGAMRAEMQMTRRQSSRTTGQLEVHGEKRLRSWTKLSQTAFAGDDFFTTAEPVDFREGDILVIPGTEYPRGDDPSHPEYEIEVVTVLRTENNTVVYLTKPLLYTHRAEILFIEGRRIDMRCEVGLLSRNVIIQGDDRSQGQLFGVHVIAMMTSIMRIEDAEVRRCGQAHVLGRYCTHSHMALNMDGSYVKSNSIHNSFQRACTTHETDYWEMRDNVAYDVMGHAYFVEVRTLYIYIYCYHFFKKIFL